MVFLVSLFTILPYFVEGDVYLHNPAGANDRNCERNVNRNNGNLLYDTQNNAKGGYACRRAVAGSNANTPKDGLTPKMTFEEGSLLEVEWTAQHGCGVATENPPSTPAGVPAPGLPLLKEDRSQNSNVHCEIVMQMGCAATFDPKMTYSGGGSANPNTFNNLIGVPREGIPNNDGDSATTRIGTNDPGQAQYSAGSTNGNLRFGVHETPEYYNECNRVSRNKGLFTADQNVNRRSAIGTRQNPNGGRRGLECPEERDYYPYWRPSPFIDVAYLVDDKDRCGATQPCGGGTGTPCTAPGGANQAEAIFQGDWTGNNQGNSVTSNGNTVTVEHGQCIMVATQKVPKSNQALNRNTLPQARRLYDRREWPATAAACQALRDSNAASAAAIQWKTSLFHTDFATNPVAGQSAVIRNTVSQGPECKTIDYSRSNHLGNSGGGDTATRYTLKIPKVNGNTYRLNRDALVGKGEPCVLRLRYNMSSSDYKRNITASLNGDESPIQQDPLVKVGPGSRDVVQLALNTNQVARTFQDRSYVFYVVKPPANRPAASQVLNMNVRGKRGNIVQTYPAVEYDLIPNEVSVTEDHILQFQWLGSDYNPRRGCNDGEGGPYTGDSNVAARLARNANEQGSNQNSRTDRTTLLLVNDAKKNYPFYTGQNVASLNPTNNNNQLFTNTAQAEKFAYADAKGQLATLNLQCLTETQLNNINNDNRRENHPRNCAVGNALSPYFSPEEVTFQAGQVGQQYLLYSARNNNFSNRDTKLKIYVKSKNANGGTVPTTPSTPQEFVYKQTALVQSEKLTDEEITVAALGDTPPFDPVENSVPYFQEAKEGCTHIAFMFSAAPQCSIVSINVLVSLLCLCYL